MNAINENRELTERQPTAGPNSPPLRRQRLLLADDSPEIRESLGKLLRGAGYDVTFAAHGGHVLDRALNEDFDLLLLDLNMPQIDGWDTLDHIASMKPSLPVIIITAQPNQREWVMSAGAHALMEKPLDLPLLLQTIEDFLEEPPVTERPRNPGTAKRERFRYGWPRRNGAANGMPNRRIGLNE